jgi:hypothetical protein
LAWHIASPYTEFRLEHLFFYYRLEGNRFEETTRNLASVVHGMFTMPDYPHFHPQTREEYLAQELAERLDDPQGLPLYLKVAGRYTESSIRQILGRALEVPVERIRTSRGALFNWLIQRHGTRRSANNTDADARP